MGFLPLGDSVADLGRILDFYVRTVALGGSQSQTWATKYAPHVQGIARRLLRLREAQSKIPAPKGAEGLLQGAPEHDWSATKDLYFYNNNAWVARGEEVLGANECARGMGRACLHPPCAGPFPFRMTVLQLTR